MPDTSNTTQYDNLEKLAGGAGGRRLPMAPLPGRTRMIARVRELEQLEHMYAFAGQGKGSLCLLQGEAGSGKTMLAEAFSQVIRANGGMVLAGRSLHDNGSEPYDAFAAVLDDWLHGVRSWDAQRLEREGSRLSEALGGLGAIAMQLNPGMAALLGADHAPVPLEPARELHRFINVLTRLLLSLAPKDTPYVLLLEDIQWMDEGGVALLAALAAEVGASPVMIVATLRDGEPQCESLRALLAAAGRHDFPFLSIPIKPFAPADMAQFVADQLGMPVYTTTSISGRLLAVTSGNPCHTASLLRAMVEAQALVRDPAGWREDPDAMRRLTAPASLVDLLVWRIRQLPQSVGDLLSAAAVMGREFSTDRLFDLLDRAPETAVPDLEMASSRFLIQSSRPGHMSFTHDRVREAVLARTDAALLALLHRRYALLLVREGDMPAEQRLFRIAHHYIEAGDAGGIRRHVPSAAEAAWRLHAHGLARRFCEAVIALGAPRDEVCLRARELLTDVHLIEGRYNDAVELATALMPLCGEPVRRAELYRKIGTAHFHAGRFREAEAVLHDGLRLLGERVPTSRAGVLLVSLGQVICLPITGLLARGHRRKRDEARSRQILALYVPLGWIHVLDDLLRFLHMSVRSLNIARNRLGPSPETGLCTSALGSLEMAVPLFGMAERTHRRAIALREAVRDEWGVGQAWQLAGYCRTWRGRNEESLACFQDALTRFERVGDEWEQGVCWNGLTNGYLRIGDYPRAIEAAGHYLEISNRTGDLYGQCTAMANLCLAHHECGRFEEGEAYGRKALLQAREHSLKLANCFSAIHLGDLLVHAGRAKEAVPLLEEAYALQRANPFIKEFSCHALTHLLEARMAHWHAVHGEGRPDPATLRAWDRMSRQAVRLTRSSPNRRGDAERVRANLLAERGRQDEAMAVLARCINQCRSCGRRPVWARAHRDMARICLGAGRTEMGIMHLREARRLFGEIGAAREAEACTVLTGEPRVR